MDIRILPSSIANTIAAGEVVQRPSSVVKELMENSLDAGADSVIVVIKDAGRTLIQVIDNGCGMSRDQAEICFERHATSKISTAEDLQHIMTFGFRGEALASIAAVAEVTLKTRREEDEVGWEVEFADSLHLATREVSTPKGANFTVRNLFYNVPARRKFLKSDNVEFKHIVEEFDRVALTRPGVSFTLIHNDRDVHVLKQAKGLKFRIQDLMGKNTVDKVVELSAQTSVLGVEGYVARPDTARKTVSDQFFFVNGRYFRSPYLHKAVMKAYEDMISDGVSPSYFIYLTVDPGQMDVNIHPTKTEVKFENDSIVFQTLYACVREALGRNAFGNGFEFGDVQDSPDLPVFGSSYDDYRPDVVVPGMSYDPSYNPFETTPGVSVDGPAASAPSKGDSAQRGGSGLAGWTPPQYSGDFRDREGDHFPQGNLFGEDSTVADTSASGNGLRNYSDYVAPDQDYGRLFEDRMLPASSVMVLSGKYLLTTVKRGLLVVNIRRATERIMYERFLAAISKNAHVAQTALFPVDVVVGVGPRLILDNHRDFLASLGFVFEDNGQDGVTVTAVPEGFTADSSQVESLLGDVLIALDAEPSTLGALMESTMAERFARLAASRGKAPTSPVEGQRLLDTLFSCQNSEFTSRGGRIMDVLPLEQFDSLFK